MASGTHQDPEGRIFAHGEVIDALCIVFAVGDEQRKHLRYRIKGYQIAGLTPPSRGAGRSSVYRLSDIYDYAFALALSKHGLDAKIIVALLSRQSFVERFGEALQQCDKAIANAKTPYHKENLVFLYYNELFRENISESDDPIKVQAAPSHQITKIVAPLLSDTIGSEKQNDATTTISLAERTLSAVTMLGLSLIDLTILRDKVISAAGKV